LHKGGAKLLVEVAQFHDRVVHGAGHGVPGRGKFGPMRFHVGLAGIGEVKYAALRLLLGPDQTLILQKLKGRVDRAGAGLPEAAAPFADILDNLVPVSGMLGQQEQNRSPDIAAADARPASTTPGSARSAMRSMRTAPDLPMDLNSFRPFASAGTIPVESVRLEFLGALNVSHLGIVDVYRLRMPVTMPMCAAHFENCLHYFVPFKLFEASRYPLDISTIH
jgi:hypothetical protein